ncbi:MAG TPA: MXAN_5187 family protein [Polyangiaceae bacterium]|nr:MXAN_5187 family protein [Polyangiaceae bacterium]
MILSRVWYVLLGVAVAVALYIVYVAVGQYNRQTTLALREGLASDSQTVEWALKIDARRRIDALLVGSVDATLQQALIGANSAHEPRVPDKSKADAKKALATINENIPADWRDDALFAVDRDGQVVAEVGYDPAVGNDDFELGGYPAVNDALHGWLRDDIWSLGSKMYVVVARPVEYDVTQRPAGAIVGLKEVNKKFVEDLASRTRTNIVFYAAGKSVAGAAGVAGLDPEKLDAIGADLKNVDDKAYGDAGRTDARMLSDDLGATYARLPGDVWALGGGFAVLRAHTVLLGPMSFLSNADDKDKANVPWLVLVMTVLVAAVVGIGFTLLEHSSPLRELLSQGQRLKSGAMDRLQLARFRGLYRLAAQGINEGIEHAIEKGGGVTRKPADLEAILGPTPAQPSMSAFSFPNQENASPDFTALGPPVAPPPAPGRPLSPPGVSKSTPFVSVPAVPPAVPLSSGQPLPLPLAQPPPSSPRAAAPPLPPLHVPIQRGGLPTMPGVAPVEDEDATTVGAVPAELMAQATGDAKQPPDESAEWLGIFDDFVRTKRQCGEPVDGLTFAKFSQTLKKNRDALVQRHGCRRVRFSVYVKEGRASLKAVPIRD